MLRFQGIFAAVGSKNLPQVLVPRDPMPRGNDLPARAVRQHSLCIALNIHERRKREGFAIYLGPFTATGKL